MQLSTKLNSLEHDANESIEQIVLEENVILHKGKTLKYLEH